MHPGHSLFLILAAATCINCNSWGRFWNSSGSASDAPNLNVISVSPANGSTNLALPTALTVTFDQAMDTTSLTTTSSGSICSGSFQVSTDSFATCLAGSLSFPSDRQVSFQPTAGFCVETQYSLQFRVTTAARAQNGQGLAATYVGSNGFSTQQALLKVNVTAGTSVNALLISCNTLFVGGAFTQVGGATRNNIAAINLITGQLTGLAPPTFALNSSASTFAIDGNSLLVGGVFTTAGGTTRNNIAAFDMTTGALTAWNPNANATVNSIAVNGSAIYVAGNFTTIGGCARNRLALFASGSNTCDPTWDPNSSTATVTTIAVSGSTVLAGGSFTGGTIGGISRNFLAAVSATGTGSGVGAFCATSPLLPTNAMIATASRLYIGGSYGPGACGISFYNFGAVDTATGASVGFASGAGTGANNTVSALSLSATKLYVGGAFTGAGSFVSTLRNYAGATDLNGAVTSWDPNFDGVVNVIANIGSSVFLGGAFSTANGGTPANKLALVDATTAAVRP